MANGQAITPGSPLLTADGIPLKESLQKSLQQSKRRAVFLVLPPLLFIVFIFIIPIGSMLTRSVDDSLINEVLPTTLAAFEEWDKVSDPPEALYAGFYTDIINGEKFQVGKAGTRMNYEKPGWRSLIKITSRKLKKIEGPPYKEAMIEIDERWTDVDFWLSLGAMKDERTLGYFLNSVDKRFDFEKNIIDVDDNRKVYNLLWYRTLLVSFIVTLACLILAYPVSYLLATLPMRISNLLMICVLMPFWTSLLVRIVAWMIMLQQEGVVNDSLVALGILDDDNENNE